MMLKPSLVRVLVWFNLALMCFAAGAYEAAMNRGAGVAIVFADRQFARFDLKAWRGVPGYPKAVDARAWPGITAGPVDAAINWGNGKAYLFRGSQYFRYDLNAGGVDEGYPKPINDRTWPGLGFDSVDAAINWGNGKAYFFSAGQYVRYDIRDDRADPGYPRRVDDRTWPGLGLERVDAAFNVGNGRAYFFGVGQFTRYDINSDRAHPDYPQPLDEVSFPDAAAFAMHQFLGGHTDLSECVDAIDIFLSEHPLSRLKPDVEARIAALVENAGRECSNGQFGRSDSLLNRAYEMYEQSVGPTASGAVTTDAAARVDDRVGLAGTWRALTDPNEMVTYDGSTRRGFYKGKQVESTGYRIQSSCDGQPGDGGQFIVTDDDFCFMILTLDASVLEVTMIGGRGNTLHFERVSDTN